MLYLVSYSHHYKKMVGVERFELPTSCSQSRRATRLRYTPTTLKRIVLADPIFRSANNTRAPVGRQCEYRGNRLAFPFAPAFTIAACMR